MEGRKTRTGRDEWRKRIERWRDNGLSAEAFAAELGTKSVTQKFWKYRIEQETRGAAGSKGKSSRNAVLKPSTLVDERGSVSSTSSFVLDLSASRRLQIPAAFDEQALERLLTVLERR